MAKHCHATQPGTSKPAASAPNNQTGQTPSREGEAQEGGASSPRDAPVGQQGSQSSDLASFDADTGDNSSSKSPSSSQSPRRSRQHNSRRRSGASLVAHRALSAHSSPSSSMHKEWRRSSLDSSPSASPVPELKQFPREQPYGSQTPPSQTQTLFPTPVRRRDLQRHEDVVSDRDSDDRYSADSRSSSRGPGPQFDHDDLADRQSDDRRPPEWPRSPSESMRGSTRQSDPPLLPPRHNSASTVSKRSKWKVFDAIDHADRLKSARQPGPDEADGRSQDQSEDHSDSRSDASHVDQSSVSQPATPPVGKHLSHGRASSTTLVDMVPPHPREPRQSQTKKTSKAARGFRGAATAHRPSPSGARRSKRISKPLVIWDPTIQPLPRDAFATPPLQPARKRRWRCLCCNRVFRNEINTLGHFWCDAALRKPDKGQKHHKNTPAAPSDSR